MHQRNGTPEVGPTSPASSQLDIPETTVEEENQETYADYLNKFRRQEYELSKTALEAYYGPTHREMYLRFLACRKQASFARHVDTGEIKVFSWACHNRWCPACAAAKARTVAGNLEKWLADFHSVRLLTLTLKHSSAPLYHQLQNLQIFFRNFRLTKLIKNSIIAGVWFMQVTYNKERKEWHPHMHCLIVGKWLDKRVISREWQKITHGSTIIDIRRVTNRAETARYVARYVSRPAMLSEIPQELHLELFYAFDGKRLYGTWGKASKAQLTRKEPIYSDKWKMLYTWEWVKARKDRMPNLQAIWQAWVEKKPCPASVTINCGDLKMEIDLDGSVIEYHDEGAFP